MRFPFWERMEMAVMWFVPMALLAASAVGWLAGGRAALAAAAMIALTVTTLLAALPRLAISGVAGLFTWGLFAAAGAGAGVVGLSIQGSAGIFEMAILGCVSLIAMAVLYLDLAGTTPWYPSNINSFGNRFRVELLEDRCNGAAACVLVCPREVLKMDGSARRVAMARPEDCIRCGACIVQCPQDALRFRFDDGRVVEPAAVRSTKLNLLGRRTVEVGDSER
jgi:NAD-dependent dihydropyrimidine dehydrogenase PreA subunit